MLPIQRVETHVYSDILHTVMIRVPNYHEFLNRRFVLSPNFVVSGGRDKPIFVSRDGNLNRVPALGNNRVISDFVLASVARSFFDRD